MQYEKWTGQKYFLFPIGVFLSHSKMIYRFIKKEFCTEVNTDYLPNLGHGYFMQQFEKWSSHTSIGSFYGGNIWFGNLRI